LQPNRDPPVGSDQHVIAGLVAATVVDRVEVIDVRHQDRGSAKILQQRVPR
jgi:hypothetical protein